MSHSWRLVLVTRAAASAGQGIAANAGHLGGPAWTAAASRSIRRRIFPAADFGIA
jgi:hypothetical protein